MTSNQPVQTALDLFGSLEEGVSSSAASSISALLAATLAVSAAKRTFDGVPDNSSQGAVQILVDAAESRREEIRILVEKEMAKPMALQLSTLLFESDPAEADFQDALETSSEVPLMIFRVCFDLVKVLHRLSAYCPPRTGAEVETAVNLTLATMSSVRTRLEEVLARFDNRQRAEDTLTELDGNTTSAGDLLEQTLTLIRNKMFAHDTQ